MQQTHQLPNTHHAATIPLLEAGEKVIAIQSPGTQIEHHAICLHVSGTHTIQSKILQQLTERITSRVWLQAAIMLHAKLL
jgi:hypothetical protein